MSEDGRVRWPSFSSSRPRPDVSVQPGERILAAGVDVDGRWHVGTQAALYVAEADTHRRIPWESVDQAAWDKEANTLTVLELADFGEIEPRTVLVLDAVGHLLELVRERITASVLLSRRMAVQGSPRKAVTVIARRSPERTGDVTFAYLIDAGLDPDSPEAREAGERGLVAIQADLGF